jgi:hypothetical protein
MKGLYRVEHDEHAMALIEMLSIKEFHRRMGHIAPEAVKALVNRGMVEGVKLDSSPSSVSCDSCEFAKATWKAIQCERVEPRAKKFGNKTHSDVWGPAPVQTKGGKEYYVSFIDDHTHYVHLHLMWEKCEVFDHYKGVKTRVKVHHPIIFQHTLVLPTLYSKPKNCSNV